MNHKRLLFVNSLFAAIIKAGHFACKISLRHHCDRTIISTSSDGNAKKKIRDLGSAWRRSPEDLTGVEHEFERNRMARSQSTGSHARWRDRRRKTKKRRREEEEAAAVATPPCHPSEFAFAPSFACHSTLASNFLHAIARYWNCLVGDLSPSVIYFLNRSYLPALLPRLPVHP